MPRTTTSLPASSSKRVSTSPATLSRSDGQRAGGPVDRPHGVADGVVELPDPRRVRLLRHARRFLQCLDDLFGRRLAGAHADRDADAVVGGAGEGQCRVRRPQRRPDGGHPVQVSRRVLRQRPTPALHVGRHRRRQRRAETGRSPGAPGRQVGVGDLERRLLAVPADRGAHQRQPVRAAQVPPLGGEEGGGLDRQPLIGRHQETGQLRQLRLRQRQGDQGDAGVVQLADASPPTPASSPASSRAAGRAGTREHHRVGASTALRRRGRADGQPPAVAGWRVSSRTAASRRIVAPLAVRGGRDQPG